MNPQIGEYWYYVDNYHNVQLGKITYFDPHHESMSRIYVPFFGEVYVMNHRLIEKWEPGWFFRMLGYK